MGRPPLPTQAVTATSSPYSRHRHIAPRAGASPAINSNFNGHFNNHRPQGTYHLSTLPPFLYPLFSYPNNTTYTNCKIAKIINVRPPLFPTPSWSSVPLQDIPACQTGTPGAQWNHPGITRNHLGTSETHARTPGIHAGTSETHAGYRGSTPA